MAEQGQKQNQPQARQVDLNELRDQIANQATPLPKSHEEIAKMAYAAYSASTDNKNYRGEEMPTWDALPVKIKTAWECATRQVVGFAVDGYEKDTAKWNGYVPPQYREKEGL